MGTVRRTSHSSWWPSHTLCSTTINRYKESFRAALRIAANHLPSSGAMGTREGVSRWLLHRTANPGRL